MQIITISGNAGRDPESRTTQGGDTVCSFNVGVRQGFDRDAPTVWYRCSIWGKSGQAAMDRIRKGSKVFVTGQFKVGEYQGNPQYEIRVNDWDAPSAGGGQRQERQSDNRGYGQNSRQEDLDDDLDSDVPF